MTVAEYVAAFLYQQEVRHVFEVSGGMIAFLIDALYRDKRIAIHSVHHEQSAAFAAEGAARITGVPGVALATSGPGAINLLTGIGSCYFDSTPAVFITGQVNRHEQKGDRAIRQLGFQETDIVAMAASITKGAWRVRSAEEVPELLARAFALALEGRPGPVLIDLPMDVQREQISATAVRVSPPAPQPCEAAFVADALRDLAKAARPLILVGGGVRSARVTDLLRDFIHAVRTPVAHSLMAVDVLPGDDPQRAGMIGTYGNRWTNLALGRADYVLVVGSRLDIRQTGSDVAAFHGDRTIYHVDCESGEMNNRVTGCRTLVAGLRPFLEEALRQAHTTTWTTPTEWLNEITSLKQASPDTAETDAEGINPNALMHLLSRASGAASAFVSDVGQHQMWAAQSLDLTATQRFLTSGGMGAMGSGLPLALGAALGSPGSPVVLIAGDGGFQLNIQELQTVVREALPLKVVILNNRCHGLVRQFQESYFDRRYPSTFWNYSAPDFAAIAKAYGVSSATVESPAGLDDAIAQMWRDPRRAYLLQVMINPSANVYPKIAFGRPITEMEPLAQADDVEST